MSSVATDRWLDVEDKGGATLVRVAHQAVQAETTFRLLGEHLVRCVRHEERPQLLLDLSGVRTLSSSLMAKLFALHQKANEAGGRLAVCCLHPDVADAFRITALDEVLHVYRDPPTALDSFDYAEPAPPA